MNSCRSALTSSVGRKALVAITGVLLVLFVVVHLLGNLQLYSGPEKFNSYAELLQSIGPGLWVARAGLFFIFLVHLAAAISLNSENKHARPEPYVYEATIQASFGSRTMVYTGLLVLGFVIYHLAHFTFGAVQPEFAHLVDANGRHDVYRMVVLGFQNPVVVLSYVVFMVTLGLHLSHGISSVFQTLGLMRASCKKQIENFGLAVGWLLALGYISLPVSVALGIIR